MAGDDMFSVEHLKLALRRKCKHRPRPRTAIISRAAAEAQAAREWAESDEVPLSTSINTTTATWIPNARGPV